MNFIKEYRALGDRYNIIDAPIFNFGIKVKIKVKSEQPVENTVFQITNDIITLMRFDLYDIGSPIDVDKIYKIIETNIGVSSVLTPKHNAIVSKSNLGTTFTDEVNILTYQDTFFSPVQHYKDGIISPPRGSIFEIRYPVNDIEIIVAD
jgi:hypothetical protein